MAQDTALLRYLLKGARRAPGSGSQRDLVFAFDGTDDYISSPVIGRTGYDMNVSGNVSTGSDGDGSYIQIDGNRIVAGTGTRAELAIASGVVFTQATSFTMKARFKFTAFAPASGASGIFGSNFDAAIYLGPSALSYGLRGSTTVINIAAVSINTLYDGYLVYDASDTKFYFYLGTSGSAATLINTGGTTAPTTFATLDWFIGDNAIGGSTVSSANKYIYHAAIRNKALTKAEIDADIALGNTAKSDPTIVAYYIPDNLQYNVQYLSFPKGLENTTKRGRSNVTSITANSVVAPDGTMTADNIVFPGGGGGSNVSQLITAISGASLASKTFIMKAFVKCTSGTQTFRLRCRHEGVSDYMSANITANTTRQEVSFAQTFTSSTVGTGITAGIVSDTTLSALNIDVRNVRLFLVNETLRDESPNIGGYLGWKQNEVISARIKPTADAVGSTGDTQCFSLTPYLYGHLRTTSNNIQIRVETRLAALGAVYTLGNGFRSKAHILGVRMWDGTKFLNKLYLNGTLVSTANGTEQAPISSGNYGNNFWMGRKGTNYFSGNIRDARVYTFTGSFTDADALAIYNGGEPTSSGVTKYLHYRPPVGEVGTTTQDQSTNDRDGTLNGGVTRDYI